MIVNVEPDFVLICKSIIAANLTDQEWDEVSAADMFQEGNYVGGYEGAESAFTFSYFNGTGDELWFQLGLPEIQKVVAGELIHIEMNVVPVLSRQHLQVTSKNPSDEAFRFFTD